jgi:hypothetical protein
VCALPICPMPATYLIIHNVITLIIFVKSTNYEVPNYAVFSSLLLPSPS